MLPQKTVGHLYRFVGEQVRRRRGKTFTQEELADMIGVSRTSITNLESGRQQMPLHQLLHVADILGCEISDLVPLRSHLGLDCERPDEPTLPVVGKLTPAARQVIQLYADKEGDSGTP